MDQNLRVIDVGAESSVGIRRKETKTTKPDEAAKNNGSTPGAVAAPQRNQPLQSAPRARLSTSPQPSKTSDSWALQ